MTDPIDVLLSFLPPAELDEEAVQKWRARMAEPLADWVALITVQIPGCTMQVCTGSKDMFGYVAVPMEIVLEQDIPRITCHLWPYNTRTAHIKIRLVRAAAKMYKASSVYSGPATISSSSRRQAQRKR